MLNKISPLILFLLILMFGLTACGQPNLMSDAPAAAASPSQTPSLQSAASPTAVQSSEFLLTSPEVAEGGLLPVEYTCDGTASTLALHWSGAPAGTVSFAVVMHHVASPEDVHWYWVLYDIPANVTSLAKNSLDIGVLGNNSVNGQTAYTPPCSKGPGSKTYTYTVYALSAQPQLSVPAAQVDRATLLAAIQTITLASAELNVTYSRSESADTQSSQPITDTAQTGAPQAADGSQPAGGLPPAEAVAACSGKAAQDACEFTAQRGQESGVCEMVQDQLACSPQRGPNEDGQAKGNPPGDDQPKDNQPGDPLDANGSAYNIEQAISDKAQGMTIAFDALAFLTGDLGADSFFPPGKVADFWGFQYLRDNDLSQMGHAGDFLTSAAMNMLNILTAEQRTQLVELASSQVASINEYGYKRFVLMQAFQRLLEGSLPDGTTSLDADAVKAYSAELYQLDGEISYARAELMGSLLNALDADQKASLDAMVGKGMLEWPDVEEPEDIRDLDRDVKVAVMTYAADMFSWYAGSVEADVYFCPERHGTYFGSFYLKDIRAMSDSSYAIPTDMTGNLGDEMLATLDAEQAQWITSLVDVQKPSLSGIVETRRQVSTELRKFLAGATADKTTVLALMKQYGELDGEIIYNLAINFTKVNQSLTTEQKAQLTAMRQELLDDLSHPTGAYLYSQAIPMPETPNTDFLFK